MKRKSVWLAVAGLMMLTGCRHVEQSPIVAAFQQAGGGDVVSVHARQHRAISSQARGRPEATHASLQSEKGGRSGRLDWHR